MIRTPITGLLRAARASAPSKSTALARRAASTHAISNPTLANIEKRWENMPPQEQAELWMALRDRMKDNWAELTLAEKKAAYWVSFGPHGPRALDPPNEGSKVLMITLAGLAVGAVLFAALRAFAGPAPHTMNKEWQEAANEYLISQKAEPITGYSSEGYTGKGQVQSPPKRG